MLSRLASKVSTRTCSAGNIRSQLPLVIQRKMGAAGGGGKVVGSFTVRTSPIHQAMGEAFGALMWLWIFHRARHDGAVLLGLRHPWDHVEDPWAAPHHDDAHDENAH